METEKAEFTQEVETLQRRLEYVPLVVFFFL